MDVMIVGADDRQGLHAIRSLGKRGLLELHMLRCSGIKEAMAYISGD